MNVRVQEGERHEGKREERIGETNKLALLAQAYSTLHERHAHNDYFIVHILSFPLFGFS